MFALSLLIFWLPLAVVSVIVTVTVHRLYALLSDVTRIAEGKRA